MNGDKMFMFNRKTDLSILMITLGCSAIFFVMAIQLNAEWLAQLDLKIITSVQNFRNESLTKVMVALSAIGSVKGLTYMTMLVTIILFIRRHHLLSLYLSISVALGAGILNQSLKLLFQRERPDILRLVSIHGYSFPSGHSMGSMIFFGGLIFVLYRLMGKTSARFSLSMIFASMILLIGLSRIYLGVHYPSDVIAGFACGALWLIGSKLAYGFFEKQNKIEVYIRKKRVK